MLSRPTIIVIGSSPQRTEAVRSILNEMAEIRSEHNPLSAVTAAQRESATIAIVDLTADIEHSLRAMQDLHGALPHVHMIALAARQDADVILRAMRAGAREFLLLSQTDEIVRVVKELIDRIHADSKRGSIISLFPVKGGMGATMLAINLAHAILEEDRKVVLVDFDLLLGDVLLFLDLNGKSTIAEVLHNINRLDRELLYASIAHHASGLHVLAQTERIEEADQVTPSQAGRLLDLLARHFDYIVCDGLRGFDELSLTVLDASSKVLCILAQDVPSVKNGQRCLDVFRRLRYDNDKVKLVVNRYLKSEKIDLQAIADNLGIPISATVANDYSTVIRSINRGALLGDAAPRAKVTEDVRTLGQLIAPSKRKKVKSGFFRMLFGLDPAKGEGEEGEGGEPEPVRSPTASHALIRTPTGGNAIIRSPSGSHPVIRTPTGGNAIIRTPAGGSPAVRSTSGSHRIVDAAGAAQEPTGKGQTQGRPKTGRQEAVRRKTGQQETVHGTERPPQAK